MKKVAIDIICSGFFPLLNVAVKVFSSHFQIDDGQLSVIRYQRVNQKKTVQRGQNESLIELI